MRIASTRKDILDAAINEFARVGFSGASTLAIARAAQITQPLLNYHFGSKENLWQASVDYAFTELLVAFESIDEISGDLSPRDTLKVILRTLNRFATRHPRHVSILRQEMGAESSRTDYLLDNYLTLIYARMNEVIRVAVAGGEIKPMPPQFLSSLLLSAATHFFTVGSLVRKVYTLDVQDRDQTETHGDWIVEVIFDGLSLRPDAGDVRSVSDFPHSKRRANSR